MYQFGSNIEAYYAWVFSAVFWKKSCRHHWFFWNFYWKIRAWRIFVRYFCMNYSDSWLYSLENAILDFHRTAKWIMWRHVKTISMISYKSVESVDILSKIPPYWKVEGKHGWKEIGKFSRFCWNVLYQSVMMFSGNKCLPHPQRQIYDCVTAGASKSKRMPKFLKMSNGLYGRFLLLCRLF